MHLRFVVPMTVARPTGGNVYDLAITEALRAQGHRVDVVASTSSAVALHAPGPGLIVIDGLLSSDRPDVVRACSAGVLIHMPLAWRDPSLAELESETLHAARFVVVTSEWTARFLLKEYGVKALVVPPGVDPAPIEEGCDPPRIVQVAALAPHKDQFSVVRSLASVADLPWSARLVGSHDADPEYAASVLALVDELGLAARIDLPGELPRDAAFAGANLVLLPSRVEAYGMVVTEALARGIPAFVNSGGPEEALGQTSEGELPGLLVEPVETTLPAELRHWLTDEAHRAELRRRALIRRTELTGWDVAAAKLSAALADPPS